jgi:hypothetical protein
MYGKCLFLLLNSTFSDGMKKVFGNGEECCGGEGCGILMNEKLVVDDSD